MLRIGLAGMAAALTVAVGSTTALAQQAQRPQIETTKVDGTDNVYIFRNGNHQSMFIVTKDGVIATDPIGYGRPTGGQDYVAEIKKVTDKPIKFLIYSHHHYDHIAGGKAFKDAGATIIAHKRAKERLAMLNDPNTPLPDQVVNDTGRTIKLGGTTLELKYLGLNHSDSSLVMRLPKEKIVFIVDTIPVGAFPGRGFIDIYPLETEEFIKKVLALDWDRLIPGHPGQPAHTLARPAVAREECTFDNFGQILERNYRAVGVSEEERTRREMLGAGRERFQAAEIRQLARLRKRPTVRRAALLRALGARHLNRQPVHFL